jgi:ArsR family transcriptional regulator
MRRRRLFLLATRLGRAGPGFRRATHALCLDRAHVAQWFHVLSDTARLGILGFLSQRERTVSELTEILDAPQSTVSFHLKVLKEAGVVREHRDGLWKYYSIRGDTLEHMMAFIKTVSPGAHRETCPLTCCQGSLTHQENLIR